MRKTGFSRPLYIYTCKQDPNASSRVMDTVLLIIEAIVSFENRH